MQTKIFHSSNILLDGEPFLGSSSSVPEETESTVLSETEISLWERTNDLLSGGIFFLGMIFAAVGVAIFWGRFSKNG